MIAGGAQFTLVVNGSGFDAGSVVQWSGTALATTFVNGTQLLATVSASLIATRGFCLHYGPGKRRNLRLGFIPH